MAIYLLVFVKSLFLAFYSDRLPRIIFSAKTQKNNARNDSNANSCNNRISPSLAEGARGWGGCF
ncbi:hypothetical protein [Helicobacter sp. T3_23-1056]